jgi:hypothetical protein
LPVVPANADAARRKLSARTTQVRLQLTLALGDIAKASIMPGLEKSRLIPRADRSCQRENIQSH